MPSLKAILIEYPLAMDIVAGSYSWLYGNSIRMQRLMNRIVQDGAFLRRNRFHISGINNEIIFGRKVRFNHCQFTIIGNNCRIIIGGGSTIVSNVHFWCQDDNSCIIIGTDFTMQGGHIASTEGVAITIGSDCMFSDDVEIRNGDSHSIIDTQTGKRFNYAEEVVIGDHVWLTAHVRVLKGSVIPTNSIVGNSSVVAGKLDTENALYSGIPCKMVKEHIDWNRNKL